LTLRRATRSPRMWELGFKDDRAVTGVDGVLEAGPSLRECGMPVNLP
jgi:hypothetical protein